MNSFEMTMLGENESTGLIQPGTAERVFEQCLYPGQQLVLAPCERRRFIRIIVGNYFPDKEAYALGEVLGIESGLQLNQVTVQPGSTVVVPSSGGLRMKHHQPESGQGLILPILLVSAADERQHSRVLG